jgi:hypothetical protein
MIVLLLTSCASIPKNSSILSSKVTEGIQKIQTENEKVIKAFADTERLILDTKWNDMYLQIEKQYMNKNNISDQTKFTHDDRRKIAANAAMTRENILNEIQQVENDLINKSRKNTDTVIMMNAEVIKYLTSLEDISVTQNNINDILKNFIDIDVLELQGITENKINFFYDNIKK